MKRASVEIDRYIENAAPFAQPNLRKIRAAFHKAEPRIEETMKWRTPTFEYKGIVGGMAAFKEHVSWGFWKAKLMSGSAEVREKVADVSQLPSEKALIASIREAVRLNDEGVKLERPVRAAKPAPVKVPQDLAVALKKNAAARAAFEKLSPSHKREYIEWITEAKQEATRTKRLATALEWMAEGKSRNWKYERKKA